MEVEFVWAYDDGAYVIQNAHLLAICHESCVVFVYQERQHQLHLGEDIIDRTNHKWVSPNNWISVGQ